MHVKGILKGDSPILDQFKDVASGTDRHCLNVSILCKAICQVLEGIDEDNLIVSARLHDIGKCFNPNYFTENQDQDNIHDEIETQVSYQYISRHVSDGVLKLIQLNAPQEIIRIVSEHHGDSVLPAIYKKAKSINKDIDKDKYRYKSCKPSSQESCILMICDVVESATRSMSNAGKLDNIKGSVDELINKMIDDEQLDILTLGQLRLIKKVLIKETKAIFHNRVEYDDVEGDDNE